LGLGVFPAAVLNAAILCFAAGRESAKQKTAIRCTLIFEPEDGSNTFLRNVSSHIDYAALYIPKLGNIHRNARESSLNPVHAVYCLNADIT
jgi:hypothetical protein